MKYLYIVTLLAATLICTNAFAQHVSPIATPDKTLSAQEQRLIMNCNLAARNSLINGDIAKVEKTCMQATKELEKSYPDKSHMIHPMLNLAFTYSLTGDYAKAEPLLARAKELGERFYKPESREMKKINDFIEDHNKREGSPPQFDKSGVQSPH